ncbi:uncharacterized protein LOC113376309 [Ctenocephalides felis]|uniref:uncharacterized protein LOC113376309 n=1 Tax=Ctenocephalides felis TaxID=7515 RepID=UPI000E6E5A28|nr:uncharacterized protein LOC113376309 [Ctenocephalides felis]
MSHLPSTFSRNSENIQRSREEPYATHIRQVNIIQPNLSSNENTTHLYQNIQDNGNLYSRSDQLPKLVNPDNYFSNNYNTGGHQTKNSDYLYPYVSVSYLLNNCDDASISHLSNQHSLFAGGQHSNSNSLPFSNLPEKPVQSESDMFINSFADNLTPNSHGVYTQFGNAPNEDRNFTPSSLVNNIEPAKPHISPIKKLEKKQSKLLYSDVLNRAVTSEKTNTVPVKDNTAIKEYKDKSKTKKIERRKSCPCVNNTPEHHKYPTNPVCAAEQSKETLNKTAPKVTLKSDSSSSEQDDLNSNVQNTPKHNQKATKTPTIHTTQKNTKREYANKENQSNQSSCDVEDSPQRQRDTSLGNEKSKSSSKKVYKQSRSVKSEKVTTHTYKKNKIRKKKKCFDFEVYLKNWHEIVKKILLWFWTLIWDIAVMSTNVATDFVSNAYTASVIKFHDISSEIEYKKILNNYYSSFDNLWSENSKFAFWRKIPFLKRAQEANNLEYEILNLAKTREEAIDHLLLHKDKDPYSCLYLDASCTGDQIRKHYKRLAMFVHPDKNDMPQAEEAFKVLQRAFDAIGEPEQRSKYDIEVARQQDAQTALNQFSVLLTELQEKIVRASNTIRCTNCNGRHLRVPVKRPAYAARECAQCKIKHSAKEGDIWAETRMMGLRWVYLACMEGSIYDISEWAACQKTALAHLTANSHNVQYRIVLGDKPAKSRTTPASNSTNFQEFIHNLCTNSMNQQAGQESGSSWRRRSPKQN